ncbi:hypothetical protein RJG79_12210 [Mycoplasmatota bacterium WC44]
MDIPNLPNQLTIKGNLNLHVALELLLLSIAHEQKALELIAEKTEEMLNYFYCSIRKSGCCCEKSDELKKSYCSLLKAISYKEIILKQKLENIMKFAEETKIEFSFCYVSTKICKSYKKDSLFCIW